MRFLENSTGDKGGGEQPEPICPLINHLTPVFSFSHYSPTYSYKIHNRKTDIFKFFLNQIQIYKMHTEAGISGTINFRKSEAQ